MKNSARKEFWRGGEGGEPAGPGAGAQGGVSLHPQAAAGATPTPAAGEPGAPRGRAAFPGST